MRHKLRWLMVFTMLLMVWGQFSYACETMDMPPQPVCCCEDGTARCAGAVPSPSEDGCHHAGPVASADSCCTVDYQSAFEDVTPSSSSTDQVKIWHYAIVLLHWPHLVSLSPLSPTTPSPDPDWLLAQADSGRSVYLSTLRLRI